MNSANREKLLLIDGSGLIYRSFFAMQRMNLETSDGVQVGGVYQFLATLLRLLDEESPKRLAIFFDTPQPTFRHELFPEYKANRAETPPELIEQMGMLDELLELLQANVIRVPGLEADDLMGAYALRGAEAGYDAWIYTSDKDMMQAVDDHVFIYSPRKGGVVDRLDREGVIEKFGVPPELVPDILGLQGDSSDNIPGVPRVGAKTARQLVNDFGSLEAIYEQLDQVQKPSVRKSLEENRELAFFCRQLATLKLDIELPQELDQLSLPELQSDRVIEELRRFGFNSLLKYVHPEQAKLVQVYHTVTDTVQLKLLCDRLNAADEFAFDLETTSINSLAAEIVGFSFAISEGEAWYVPADFGAENGALFSSSELPEILEILRPVLENSDIGKIGQNVKYDMHVLRNYDIQVRGVHFDTMVASFLINPSQRQHNLDALSLQYLSYTKVPTSDLIGKGSKQISMREVPLEKISFYACEDVDMTLRLKSIFAEKLTERDLQKLLSDIEIPVLHVLLEMERQGVRVDTDWLRELSQKYELRLQELEQEIHSLAGGEFNINSPRQLGEVLFEKLQLPRGKKGKTGYSTDVTVLEKLAHLDPLPGRVLEHRRLSKLQNTYIASYFELENPKTGRIHTSFNQTVAATGRLSSSDPNLQNIPIRTEEGKEIRRAFVSRDENHILLAADYSQIELRMFAHLSRDEELTQAFRQGVDIHRATAAAVFELAPEDVSDDLRREAKIINFGVMYGMGSFGLGQELGIPRPEAQRFIDDYFSRFPAVRQFVDSTIAIARERGYVETMFKRRRYLPEIHSSNHNLRSYAERAAVNSVVQGSAADLIKIAMIRLHNRWQTDAPQLNMTLQVHDELLFDIPCDKVDEYTGMIRYEMENAVKLSVPVTVDIGQGQNWLQAH
jgi:DNA polymerase I